MSQAFCGLDVLRLCALAAGAEEDDDPLSSLLEVHAISGSDMDAQFADSEVYKLLLVNPERRKAGSARPIDLRVTSAKRRVAGLVPGCCPVEVVRSKAKQGLTRS